MDAFCKLSLGLAIVKITNMSNEISWNWQIYGIDGMNGDALLSAH